MQLLITDFFYPDFSYHTNYFFVGKRKRKRGCEDIEECIKKLKICNGTKDTYLGKPVYQDMILFKSSDIYVSYDIEKDNFSMFSTNLIHEGTLLIIEEAFVGTNNFIAKRIEKKTQFIKELYPRNGTILDKLSYNTWDWCSSTDLLYLQDSSGLCPYITKINHSCEPNSIAIKYALNKTNTDEYKGLLVLYAVKNILPNTEITTSYGFEVGHPSIFDEEEQTPFNWKCRCNRTYKERNIMYKNLLKKAKLMWHEDKDYVLNELLK